MKKLDSNHPLRRVLRASAAAAWLAVAVGSAAAATLVPEAAVRERANERWLALVDAKFERAYEFLAPGYRAVHSYRNFFSQVGSAAWTGADVARIDCNDARDKCVAVVRVGSKVFMPRANVQNLSGYVTENWIKQDGSWWFFPAD